MILEEIYAFLFLAINFAVKIMYMGGLCIRASVIFPCFFYLGRNRLFLLLLFLIESFKVGPKEMFLPAFGGDFFCRTRVLIFLNSN